MHVFVIFAIFLVIYFIGILSVRVVDVDVGVDVCDGDNEYYNLFYVFILIE
jgi:hypothetical protein